jgi:serine/threonine protein kinase
MANILGTTLLNQYRVDAFISSGSTGAVYRVWDLKRNVSLAMKVLHSDLLGEPSVLKRFRREANALKKLTHPHIVQFYGLYQTSEVAFLLERFIDGPSLKDVFRQQAGRPLPVSVALIFIKAVCSALGYAHAMGVVHCDVKPGNIIMDKGGNIYLTDFGIARHAESTLTAMADIGTPAYMAPEQIRGESVTPATDVYALGVVLFEMLTGEHPFYDYVQNRDKFQFKQDRIRFYEMLPPKRVTNSLLEINPSLPKELSSVVLKALERKHEDRFASVQDFYERLLKSVNKRTSDIPDFLLYKSGEVSEKKRVANVFLGRLLGSVNKQNNDVPDFLSYISSDVIEKKHVINVFLCHASEDKPVVNELYQRLKKLDWINPWLDKEKLLPGQDFDLEIEKTIESADAVIAFISKSAVQKTGYIQKELKLIYDAAMYRPDDVLFAIPLRLEKCDPPHRFKRWHWGDYFGNEKEKTYEALLKSLRNIYEQSLQIDSDNKTD